MELHVLIGQRKCNYPGEYAPESLACATGPEYDDDQDYLDNCKANAKTHGEFTALEIITLEFSTEELERRLFPEREPIKAEVK